jgi:diguanylate cyclase (GGDEF)-like protein
LKDALKSADAALMSAKNQGKNVVSRALESGFELLVRLEGPEGSRAAAERRRASWAKHREAIQAAMDKLRDSDPAAYASLLARARHDPVSGTSGAESIHWDIEMLLGSAAKPGPYTHVLVLELDGFKAFNDHPDLGHDVGDAALRGFGQALLAAADKTEDQVHVARARGKEFHVLGTEESLERFQKFLYRDMRASDPVMTEAAREYFLVPDPAPEQVAAVRRMAQEQAVRLGKDPSRLGRATGAIEPITLKDAILPRQSYAAAVAKARDRIDALKSTAERDEPAE